MMKLLTSVLIGVRREFQERRLWGDLTNVKTTS
jgi:hypothetical protein